MSRRASPCNAIRELTSLSLDSAPSKIEQRLIEAHIASCGSCAEFAADIDVITLALRGAALEPVPSPIVPTRRWLGVRGHVRPWAQRGTAAAALVAGIAFGVLHLPAIDPPEALNLTRPVAPQEEDDELRELRRSEIVDGQIQIVAKPAPTGIGAMKPALMPNDVT